MSTASTPTTAPRQGPAERLVQPAVTLALLMGLHAGPVMLGRAPSVPEQAPEPAGES